ncbi:hypothetical protein D3C76_1575600 [compost metagenome]
MQAHTIHDLEDRHNLPILPCHGLREIVLLLMHFDYGALRADAGSQDLEAKAMR